MRLWLTKKEKIALLDAKTKEFADSYTEAKIDETYFKSLKTYGAVSLRFFDIAAEKETANALIADGCILISQHADSEGAPKACEEAGVPNVAYNLDTRDWGPNTALISSKINWAPYFEHIIDAAMNGKEITQDFCGGLKEDVVQILGFNDKVAAPGTMEKLEEVKAKLISGELKVFDTATFTVDGKTVNEYMADVDSDEAFTGDTQVIADGYFHESEYRSAPYFDLDIDGITIK